MKRQLIVSYFHTYIATEIMQPSKPTIKIPGATHVKRANTDTNIYIYSYGILNV